MRAHLVAGLALLASLLAAPSARAELTLSASGGVGVELRPQQQLEAGNVMLAPGYRLLGGLLRPELGVAVAWEAARQLRPSRAGLELRPMLVVAPPLLPLYLRLVTSGVDLFSRRYRTVAYGGALGLQLQVAGLGVFAEAGILPRQLQERLRWVLEGRVGIVVALG